MDKPLSIDRIEYSQDASSAQRLARGYGFVNAGAHTLIGITMLTLLFLTNGSVLIKGIEVVLSLSMLVASLLMWSELMLKEQQTAGGVLLAGDLALAVSFLYLGVAIPAFHQGYTTPTFALAQFITVLAGLIAGSGALVLARSLSAARRRGVIRFSDMVRDGVQLITGTILFGIALSQLVLADLKAPQWSWISFLGITIPGMLILVGREGLKERCEGVRGWRRVPSQLLIELLLIVGLSIMLYGSYVNLTLGANGYLVGIKGNAAGFRLWLIAALLLVGVRGGFKLAFGRRSDQLWYRVLNNLLYVLLLVPFIYGARSVFAGQPPLVRIGAAWPDVVPILIAAILLLVVGRSVGQKGCA
ncbi:hypothetical protein [Dictyobacter aurantiacus]|uniref:Uncharacterized protein n=1 Tax=Dictyobacter aurantiacus TaxID=1936993 RepID=A0A401ZKU5_9CHLR|nr:hypothetical protein [Dictyobacter aurantiacus]GCE07434.1 hypothetical protein KDAU_47630 [Dictyobacter aurantiacus]